ncbi:MAG: DUF1203 domain-containing protein [Pseudomonadota bacterium]
MPADTTTRLPYKILPVHTAFLTSARDRGLDDLAQTVERHVASGGEPCRDVFRRAAPGEAILLASYSPFELATPYKEFGPVFVMANAARHTPPPDSLAALARNGYLGEQFVLRAYSAAERIVDGVVVTREQAEDQLQTMLRDAEVCFVLVRFAGYGCYACRIERV